MRARSHKTFIRHVLRDQRVCRKPVKWERSLRYLTTTLCQMCVTLAVTDAVLTIARRCITAGQPLNAIPRAIRLKYTAQTAGLLGG